VSNEKNIEHIFRAYDIRGVIGKDLTSQIVAKIGASFGVYVGRGRSILVGHDARTSSVMVKNAIISGLLGTGINVYDVGLLPIPLVNFYTWKHGFDGAVVITASHNPPEYNGIRFRRSDGTGYSSENREVANIFLQNKIKYASWNELGEFFSIDTNSVIESYTAFVTNNLSVSSKLTALVDPGNGAASFVAPHLFRKIGVNVVAINSFFDGTFPARPSDPLKLDKSLMKEFIVDSSADFGVAYDGDGDRAVFFDEKGNMISPEKAGIIFGKYLLSKSDKKDVVANISCSMILNEALSAEGATVHVSKVGDVFVAEKIKEVNAILGVESSAHYFFPFYGFFYDDAIFGSLLMAEILSNEKEPLSSIVKRLPTYPIRTLNIECRDDLKFKVIEKLHQTLSTKENLNMSMLDGLKIISSDGWILIRPSNTEPLIRITIEGHSESAISKIEKEYIPLLQTIISELE